ncbi:nucleotidyltransferase domain-containing protein [Prauserella alba]|uniref:Nucleotidyltransferase domain-containing protein n=1 Tax=Prauserella alba TaxID=176898 RepID=A0ABN1VC10_9PSEU|nr:nucleotidyltransferase domain-containing protein [Prauserella alba]MCP2179023.1 hypothetical protein [Prauserella alba]
MTAPSKSSPYDALNRLRTMSADGSLATLCARHGVDLLVAHGSAVASQPLRAPHDLDLAYLTTRRERVDRLALTNALLDALRFDDLDLMDLNGAGAVAKARAMGPGKCELLHEAAPSLFATTQVAALKMEMETRWLRRLDLELMAE